MRVALNKTYEKNRENMNEYLKIEQGIESAQMHSNMMTQKQKEEILAR